MTKPIAAWLVAILMAILPSAASPAGDAAYFLSGQAHPRFHLTIALNGEVVKQVTPSAKKLKVFLKQLDADLLRGGENEITVTYEVQDEGEDMRVPSFRVNLKAKPGGKLLRLKGPKRPFPDAGATGTLSGTFTVEK